MTLLDLYPEEADFSELLPWDQEKFERVRHDQKELKEYLETHQPPWRMK